MGRRRSGSTRSKEGGRRGGTATEPIKSIQEIPSSIVIGWGKDSSHHPVADLASLATYRVSNKFSKVASTFECYRLQVSMIWDQAPKVSWPGRRNQGVSVRAWVSVVRWTWSRSGPRAKEFDSKKEEGGENPIV